MLCQTIDQIRPLLEMMQQPAFCLREDGTIVSNRAAEHLTPLQGDDLALWLGESAPAYAAWDRTGSLELPVIAGGQPFSATVQTLQDGLLWLLHGLRAGEGAAMRVTAQVLRQPLTDLSVHMQMLTDRSQDPALLEHAAAMQRLLYRISRITANLSDLELLQQEQYTLRIQRLDAAVLLPQLLDEVSDLAMECGHPLSWSAPEKGGFFNGDESLIKRAILNLISNAIKYSPPNTPISIQAVSVPERLLFRITNLCDEDASVILRGAFDRLHQRDLLPDPKWGIGLGLPLAQEIARVHGGTVALEYRDGTVTVILSISRRRSTEPPLLRVPAFHYDGGLRQTLVELSDCLPNRLYHPDAL